MIEKSYTLIDGSFVPDCAAGTAENGSFSASEPPNLYNMGGLNPHSSFVTFCGLDALVVNFSIYWGAAWGTDAAKEKKWSDGEGNSVNRPGRFEGFQIRETLEKYKVIAELSGEIVEIESIGARIHPGGGKIAEKYCRYKIEIPAAIILIADQPTYRGAWPNVKIEIGGERCLTFAGGAIEAYRVAANFITDVLGGELHKERVSRADLCADFPEWSMNPFYHSAQKRHYACRARLYHPYVGHDGISLYWGSGACVLRIYDKLREMAQSALRGSPAKYQHMIVKRWGGKEPSCAVRVEYQLRTEFLRKYGVTDVDSLQFKTGDLIRYLCGKSDEKWFRFLTAKPQEKHSERNITLPRWEIVQSVFCDRFLLPEPLREIDPNKADIETLLKQALGVLKCAAANRGYVIPGKESCAPQRFYFANYEAFEKWACTQLRSVAVVDGWETIDSQRKADILKRWNQRKAKRRENKENRENGNDE